MGPEGRPLAGLFRPREAYWEFSLRLLRSFTTSSVAEPMWSIDWSYFGNKLVLIWPCLMEIRVIKDKNIVSIHIKF